MMVEKECPCGMRFRVPYGDEETLCPRCKPRGYDGDVSVSNPLSGTYSVGIINTKFVKTLGMLRPRVEGID